MAPEQVALVLPLQVATPVDIGRLLRELEQVNESVMQQDLRKAGPSQLPQLGILMGQMVQLNKLDLLQAADRQRLQQFLTTVKQKSPVLHMSFSADPAPAFVEKLMAWLRREIDPLVLLTVGLQPNIGAGCVVRSTNKQFDFSLRQNMLAKRDLLLQAMSQPAKGAQS